MLKAFLKTLHQKTTRHNDLQKENQHLRQEIQTLKLENEALKAVSRQTDFEEQIQGFMDSLIESLGLEDALRYSVRGQRLIHVSGGTEWPVYAPLLWQYIQYWLAHLIDGKQMKDCLQEAENYVAPDKTVEADPGCPCPEELRQEARELKRIFANT